jgi:hypothetical protein
LVFKIKRAGSIKGRVRTTAVSGFSPYLVPDDGVEGVQMQVEFSPQNFLWDSEQLKAFSLLTTQSSSDNPYSLDGVTYLSRDFLG